VHGLIFMSFRDYLAAVHGADSEQEVLAGEPVYLMSEAYSDERFSKLVERACETTGLAREALLRDFGAFTAERTFVRLYPALFDLAGSARSFLLTVEKPIHELVRVAIPNARPPKLAVSELDEHRISIVYTSPRRLCALLRGLVDGTARHYREIVRLDERSCMNRGDRSCTFEVHFEGRAQAAEVSGRPSLVTGS
jgi:predicted hydrocarbon binding protein